MKRFFERGACAAFGLWIGAVACVAFVVAPAVFHRLPDRQAGDLMAPIFRAVDVFGIAAAALFALAARGRWRTLLAVLLGAAALVNVAVVAPKVTARENLELYHRIAEGLWGFILLGGLGLLLAGDGRR